MSGVKAMTYNKFYDYAGLATCTIMMWYEIDKTSSIQAFIFGLINRLMLLYFLYHLIHRDENNQ